MASTRCIAIGAGGNIGDASGAIRRAFSMLSASPLILRPRLSPLYRTVPVRVDGGGPDPGGEYTNAAVAAESAAEPGVLLDLLQGIERTLGRDRTVSPHGAPRPIDLDLLVVGDLVSTSLALELPHPRMHQRAFVLVPLADVAPELRVPGPAGGRTVAQLLAALGPLDSLQVRRIAP